MVKKKANKIKTEKKTPSVPVGIKIISIYCYLVFALEIFSLITIGIGEFTGLLNILELTGKPFMFLAIQSLIISILYLITAIYLWKLKLWAKYIAMFLSVYTIIIMLMNFDITLILVLIIAVAILLYLFLNKSAKEAFK